jgi:hypothetical protein
MYLNAKDCALDWIGQSAAKASANGKRALFYTDSGKAPLRNLDIGEYYITKNLEAVTETLVGTKISTPYQPLFDTLTKMVLAYPNLMIYVVHGDGQLFS